MLIRKQSIDILVFFTCALPSNKEKGINSSDLITSNLEQDHSQVANHSCIQQIFIEALLGGQRCAEDVIDSEMQSLPSRNLSSGKNLLKAAFP